MDTVREVREVHSSSITIKLPASFQAKRVEILIRSLDEEANAEGLGSLQEFLLSAPTSPDAELEPFQAVGDWMDSWNDEE